MKVEDNDEAMEYGVSVLPVLIYFENSIPSIYDGDLMKEEEVLDWLIEQKTSDTIEEVTDKILEKLIENEEYLAVFFSGRCSLLSIVGYFSLIFQNKIFDQEHNS